MADGKRSHKNVSEAKKAKRRQMKKEKKKEKKEKKAGILCLILRSFDFRCTSRFSPEAAEAAAAAAGSSKEQARRCQSIPPYV